MTVQLNKAKLERLIRETPERADQMLRGAATEMVNDIKLSFGTGPAGETYQRGTVMHVASREGNPPNSDTGTLVGSIMWTPDGPLRILIHDGTLYGILLEWGTERMGARPFVTPVFEKWRQGELARFVKDFGVFRG